MRHEIRNIFSILLAAAFCLAVLSAPAAALEGAMSGHVFSVAASDEKGYGAKKPVATEKEARAALDEHFKGKDVTVGEIKEKEFYFEAEILDKKGEVSDRVIIDKRTGRIRSIY